MTSTKIRIGNMVLTTVTQGKTQIRAVRPLKTDIPEELCRNVTVGMMDNKWSSKKFKKVS